MLPILRLALALCLAAPAALADPAAPALSPGVQLVDYGIYCETESTGTQPAPETSLGYIDMLPGVPEMIYRQQTIPARLGTSFGVVIQADRDIPGARIETWKPGAARAETWYDDIFAGSPQMRGFAFDYPEEIILGTWRMEAWEGSTRLYSVEFEVQPSEKLPGVTSDCKLMS